jgi:hypothetical protein
MQSPTALLIKNQYNEYLLTYDEEYDIFHWSFQEEYFSSNYLVYKSFCRCHMKNDRWTQNKCMMCGTIEWKQNNKINV